MKRIERKRIKHDKATWRAFEEARVEWNETRKGKHKSESRKNVIKILNSTFFALLFRRATASITRLLRKTRFANNRKNPNNKHKHWFMSFSSLNNANISIYLFAIQCLLVVTRLFDMRSVKHILPEFVYSESRETNLRSWLIAVWNNSTAFRWNWRWYFVAAFSSNFCAEKMTKQ